MKAFVTAQLSNEVLSELKKLLDVKYEPWRKTGNVYFDAKELAEKLEGIDIFITETDDLKKKELFELTNLKLLISCRGDPFNVNLKAATERKVPVVNTPLRNVVAVAELTIAYMFMLARNLQKIERIIHSDEFEVIEFEDYVEYLNQFEGAELFGKTVGIIGLGQIGRRVVDRLKSFGVNVLLYDPFVSDEFAEGFGKKVELNYLMRNSDFISIHAVATEDNDNLINKERIEMMKKTAYLINLAKGSLVDYDALHGALKERKIAGAALDVFPIEPIDEDNEFIELDNAIIAPHIGGDTKEVIERQSTLLFEDIKSWLNGEIPKHILNPEVFNAGKTKELISNAEIYELKKNIVELCQNLVKEGHLIGSAGNVSIRIKNDEKEMVLITPSNVRYDEMMPNDILIIGMDGKVLDGDRNPSVEKHMHLGVYKERDDVNAVIHAHSIYSTVLSALRLSIPPVMEELVPYVGGEIICAEYGEAGSEELAEGVKGALDEKNAILLANHGNLCCGSHLDGAYTVLQYVERGAKIYYLTKVIADPTLLPEDTVDYEVDIFEIFKESKQI